MLKNILRLAFIVLFSSKLFALPQIEGVAHGEATVSQMGSETGTLHVQQHTEHAIINWDSFNIDAHEKVHFQQPTDAVCLNRINAANGMSQIQGKLSATGDIYLINQAGILFSDTARINVGSLVASTIDMADQNFLDDKFIFDVPSTMNSSIINRGVISVDDIDGGFVTFLGSSVADEGIINVNMGTVALVSGQKFMLDFYGDGVLNYVLEPVTAAGVDENGKPLPHGVNVSGEVSISNGGMVYMSARAAQGVFDNIINTTGVVRATSVVENRGVIILKGEDAGVVHVTGTLDVAGVEAGANGGAIAILGETLDVDDAARFNVAGDKGDGAIIVGWPERFGDGVNFPIKIATPMSMTYTQSTYVGPQVVLNADAKTVGNGGNIVIFSTKNSTFLGKASTRGGEVSGNGGNILVFSSGTLGDSATSKANLDMSAPNGHAGESVFSTDPKIITTANEIMNDKLSLL